MLDLGLVEKGYYGQRLLLPHIRAVFETDQTHNGRPCFISKDFVADLHPDSHLSQFAGPLVAGAARSRAAVLDITLTDPAEAS